MSNTDPWLTVRSAAEYVAKHPRTVSNAIRNQELQAERRTPRSHWRTKKEYLDRWLSRQ